MARTQSRSKYDSTEAVGQQSQVCALAYLCKTLQMRIADQLRCLFSGSVEEVDNSYVIEVPEEEIQLGDLQGGETYRVAILPTNDGNDGSDHESDPEPERHRGPSEQPVELGDQRTVEIEDIGEQGDGITRVDNGFIVIVPDTEMGERVTIEITDVGENVAFAEVEERVNYYD